MPMNRVATVANGAGTDLLAQLVCNAATALPASQAEAIEAAIQAGDLNCIADAAEQLVQETPPCQLWQAVAHLMWRCIQQPKTTESKA